MAHLFRFFAKPHAEGVWTLGDQELEHVRKVLKIKVGNTVEVMNGEGAVGVGTVSDVHKDFIQVKVDHVTYCEKPTVKKALAFGALKPGDVDDLMADLVELGMDEIHIFQQEDTAKYRTSERPRERWERILLSATKQSKRAWLPKVYVHESLKTMLLELKRFEARLVMDVAGSKSLLDFSPAKISSIAAIIGGERGLSPSELDLCEQAGFTKTRMGLNILRAKTAAVAVAAVLGMR